MYFYLSLLLISLQTVHCFRFHGKHGMLGVPKVPKHVRRTLETASEDLWFTQRLDHFVQQDVRVWQQRYFVNSKFYKPGGPVFIQIGGEGTASPIWMNTGHWITMAKKMNALCFQLEHRYYGKSHPTPDLSVKNLAWLTSEQALADLANFRAAMTKQYNLGDAKWIAFGGSYPGSLSAWFRIKYPHMVHAAVSSSAPLLATVNFPEYMEVVKNSLATTGQLCNKVIADAIKNLTHIITSGVKPSFWEAELKEKFQLCDTPDFTRLLDMENLQTNLAGNFAGVVQYNKDNRAFEGVPGTNVTIDTLCGIMNKTGVDPLTLYADVNSLMLKTYNQSCSSFSYKEMISDLRKTDWNSSASVGGRQWLFQTCNEFGFYQTSDSKNQPFYGFPLSFSVQQCKDIFGEQFDLRYIAAAVNATNQRYGARNVSQKRIVFVNGSIDPWHALGITNVAKTQDYEVIYIQGTAHCANMYPESSHDPQQLTDARTKIESLVEKWLKEEP